MTGALNGADVVYLRSIPLAVGGHEGLFDGLSSSLAVETLYRSQYSSWEECDRLQRSKSRRKHDRQQGDRLTAMGKISFEEICNGGDTGPVIETMFRQRSARFKAMGIRDTFVQNRLIGFYYDSVAVGSGIDVRLHVLRLNGYIVTVRYNIVHNYRMFCLISSMSDDPAIQNGSPDKQCLFAGDADRVRPGHCRVRHGQRLHRQEAALVQCADAATPALYRAQLAGALIVRMARQLFDRLGGAATGRQLRATAQTSVSEQLEAAQ
ncbi:MAG: GNAT family N-acetyltransferase [Candidatus Devosia euplotis]|nr:GNAT family N-acetyltransferase [Candidatus Devosia euplotis]